MPALAVKLTKLNRSLRRLTAAETLPALVESILDVVEDVFGRDTAALLLVEPDGLHLRIAASRGYDPQAIKAYDGKVGESIAGLVAQTGKPWLVRDVTQEHRYLPGVHDALSEMAVPLLARGRVMGVLDVESRGAAFEPEDMALLTAFGEHAAWALKNLEQLQVIERQANRLRLLNRAGRALNTRLDVEELILEILKASNEALGLGRVALLLLDPEARDLVVHSAVGYWRSTPRPSRKPTRTWKSRSASSPRSTKPARPSLPAWISTRPWRRSCA